VSASRTEADIAIAVPIQPLGQRPEHRLAGIYGLRAELLLDAQQLVVLGGAVC
jgi:hypothetical protein